MKISTLVQPFVTLGKKVGSAVSLVFRIVIRILAVIGGEKNDSYFNMTVGAIVTAVTGLGLMFLHPTFLPPNSGWIVAVLMGTVIALTLNLLTRKDA